MANVPSRLPPKYQSVTVKTLKTRAPQRERNMNNSLPPPSRKGVKGTTNPRKVARPNTNVY